MKTENSKGRYAARKITGAIFVPSFLILFLCFNLPFVQADKVKVRVYAYHDDRETFIYTGEKNYPEIATIAFVAVNVNPGDPNTGKPILYDGAINVKVKSADYNLSVPYSLIDMTSTDMFKDLKHLAEHWNGLFCELDYSGAELLLSGLRGIGLQDHPNDGSGSTGKDKNIDVKFGVGHNPVIIGVESWNYKPGATLKFDISVVEHSVDADVELMNQQSLVITGIDNVNLVRENIFKNGDITKQLPPKGQCYTGDPGPWVIDFGDKTINPNTGHGIIYDGILGALVKAEKYGGPRPVSGGGPDWLQVAAADRCAANTPVFNCVWKIVAAPNLIDPTYGSPVYGMVNDFISPYMIELNSSEKAIRFDEEGMKDIYGFRYYGSRQVVIDHEALHTYHLVRGELVYDDDDDMLYVNSATENTQNTYLNFSFDNKSRGFRVFPSVYVASSIINPDKWDASTEGCGDKGGTATKAKCRSGYFMQKMQLTSDAVMLLFGDPENGISPVGFAGLVPTTIPNDIPKGEIMPQIIKAFLYKGGDIKLSSRKQNVGFYWIHFDSSNTIPPTSDPDGKRLGANGYYVPGTIQFKFGPYDGTADEAKQIISLIKNYGYDRLVILYEIVYHEEPFEYDANCFGTKIQ